MSRRVAGYSYSVMLSGVLRSSTQQYLLLTDAQIARCIRLGSPLDRVAPHCLVLASGRRLFGWLSIPFPSAGGLRYICCTPYFAQRACIVPVSCKHSVPGPCSIWPEAALCTIDRQLIISRNWLFSGSFRSGSMDEWVPTNPRSSFPSFRLLQGYEPAPEEKLLVQAPGKIKAATCCDYPLHTP